MVISGSPKVFLISEFNEFSFEFFKRLEEKNFSVTIVSDESSSWKNKIDKEKVLILDIRDAKSRVIEDADYVVCIPRFSFNNKLSETEFKKDLEKINLAKSVLKTTRSKAVFIFSYLQNRNSLEKTLWVLNMLSDEEVFSANIFLGDLIFEEENEELGFFQSEIKKAMKGEKLSILKSFVFFPISNTKASKILLRSLLSLKAYNQNTAIIGKSLSLKELARYLRKINPSLNIDSRRDSSEYFRPEVQEKVFSDENKKELVLKATSPVKKQKPKGKSLADRKRWTSFKWKIPFTAFLFIFFVTPLLLVALSFFGTVFSKKLFAEGLSGAAEKQLEVTLALSQVGEKYFNLLSGIPSLGKPYKKLSNTLEVLQEHANVGLRFLKTFNLTSELFENVVVEKDFDLVKKTNQISLEMDNLYKDISFLEGEVQSSNTLTRKMSDYIFRQEDLEKIKNKVYILSRSFLAVPKLLGKDGVEKYLILFQNNSTARPTGGVIESFILTTFSDGKLVDIKIYDTKVTDRNLSGVVEPPPPFKKYFAIDAWNLIDSNWDPDFQLSASQAEWFVDKEIDESVDGVIAFDANFLQKLIHELGGFELDEGKVKVNSENFFEIIKKEGDEEKASATLILEKLFSQGKSFDKVKKTKILQSIFKSIEEKDVLIFIKDLNIQKDLQDLGWAGSFDLKDCSGNCYSDQLAVVESAFSDNSFDINREMEMSLFLEENLLKRKLLIYFENKSDEPYKAYLRLFVPGNVGFSPSEIIGFQGRESKDLEVRGIRGFKEAGLFYEIPARQTQAISFLWESGSSYSYEKAGEYKLYLWKQPGLKNTPLEIQVKAPSKLNLKATHPFSLTNENLLRYNTLLSQDLTLNLFWEKNE